LSCAICEIRKEKRFCPAVHGRICPQCCGEQREVTLDCPSECPYLQQAREHEKPRPAEQFDAAALFLHVEISEQFTFEREHLLMGLSYALAKAAQADRTLNDRELIATLSALCTSQERLELRPALRAAADQRNPTGRGRAGAGDGEAVSRGRTKTVGILYSKRFRHAEGFGVPSPFGPRSHVGTAQVAGVHRFPFRAVSREAICFGHTGRIRQPDHRAVKSATDFHGSPRNAMRS